MVMETSYNLNYVVLSVLVALFASYAALDLVGSVIKAKGFARFLWLAVGSLSMGVGIWSMHFIGMLAFNMDNMPMAYDMPLMALSVIIAFVASTLALYLVSRSQVSFRALGLGGVAMAMAIAGMHYTGMYSMRMAAKIEWNYWLVALSVIIALVASFSALFVAIRLRQVKNPLRLQILAGTLMGLAIAGMHYTGMEAATFVHVPGVEIIEETDVLATSELGFLITISTLFILTLALSGSITDRAFLRRNQRAEESIRLFREAEAASLTKTRFLANMSHEIRTPLGAIIGFTTLLQEESLTEKQRSEYLGIIHRSALALSGLLDDILDLSKIEMGRLELEDTVVPILQISSDVVSLMRIKAQEKGLVIELHSEPNVPSHMVGDSVRLRQILLNIIGNAIKFTPRGRIDIFQRLLQQNGESYLAIEVRDTGIGLSSDQRDRLFKAFSQADTSTTRKYGGSGLGLELSRRLARAMGGDLILLESHLGKGSSFLVTIRLREQHGHADLPMPKSQRPPPTPGQELKGRRILLAEDVIDNQILVRHLLEKRGAIVEFADNGQEAVNKAGSRDFDLVLMDVQMPVMDGYDATRELRRRGFKKPIVALTAHAMKEGRQECFESGCSDFITKPIDVHQLVPTLLRHLEV